MKSRYVCTRQPKWEILTVVSGTLVCDFGFRYPDIRIPVEITNIYLFNISIQRLNLLKPRTGQFFSRKSFIIFTKLAMEAILVLKRQALMIKNISCKLEKSRRKMW